MLFTPLERGPLRRLVSASVSYWPGCGDRCRRRTAASDTALHLPGQVSSWWSLDAPAGTESTECRRERLSEVQPSVAAHPHWTALPTSYVSQNTPVCKY